MHDDTRHDRREDGRDAPRDGREGADAQAPGRGARHEPGGPGDGMRTGGSAGTASGSDPMAGEYDGIHGSTSTPDRDPAVDLRVPSTARTKGDGAGTV